MINLCDLQVGLLNIGDSRNKVQDLLVSLLSAAVCDPGLPAGHKVRACHHRIVAFVLVLICKCFLPLTHVHEQTCTKMLSVRLQVLQNQ